MCQMREHVHPGLSSWCCQEKSQHLSKADGRTEARHFMSTMAEEQATAWCGEEEGARGEPQLTPVEPSVTPLPRVRSGPEWRWARGRVRGNNPRLAETLPCSYLSYWVNRGCVKISHLKHPSHSETPTNPVSVFCPGSKSSHLSVPKHLHLQDRGSLPPFLPPSLLLSLLPLPLLSYSLIHSANSIAILLSHAPKFYYVPGTALYKGTITVIRNTFFLLFHQFTFS